MSDIMKLDKNQIRASKTMSYALRHNPEKFGLKLDSGGWVDIDVFCNAISRELGCPVSIDDINAVIADSEKKRFEIAGSKIRATYGHSFDERVKYDPVVPPEVLYHGTSHRAYASICKQGLKPMNRQYVHLSSDIRTALLVGKRHDDAPVLLEVDASRMHADGFKFYHSANDGTWLCSSVPPKYLHITTSK